MADSNARNPLTAVGGNNGGGGAAVVTAGDFLVPTQSSSFGSDNSKVRDGGSTTPGSSAGSQNKPPHIVGSTILNAQGTPLSKSGHLNADEANSGSTNSILKVHRGGRGPSGGNRKESSSSRSGSGSGSGSASGNSAQQQQQQQQQHHQLLDPVVVEDLRRLISLPFGTLLGSLRDAEKLEGMIERIEEFVEFFYKALELHTRRPDPYYEIITALTFNLLDEAFRVILKLPKGSLACNGTVDDRLLSILKELAATWVAEEVFVDASSLATKHILLKETSQLTNHLVEGYLDIEPDTKITVSVLFPRSWTLGRKLNRHGGSPQNLVVVITLLAVVGLVVAALLSAFRDSTVIESNNHHQFIVIRIIVCVLGIISVIGVAFTMKLWIYQSKEVARSFESVERNARLGLYAPPPPNTIQGGGLPPGPLILSGSPFSPTGEASRNSNSFSATIPLNGGPGGPGAAADGAATPATDQSDTHSSLVSGRKDSALSLVMPAEQAPSNQPTLMEVLGAPPQQPTPVEVKPKSPNFAAISVLTSAAPTSKVGNASLSLMSASLTNRPSLAQTQPADAAHAMLNASMTSLQHAASSDSSVPLSSGQSSGVNAKPKKGILKTGPTPTPPPPELTAPEPPSLIAATNQQSASFPSSRRSNATGTSPTTTSATNPYKGKTTFAGGPPISPGAAGNNNRSQRITMSSLKPGGDDLDPEKTAKLLLPLERVKGTLLLASTRAASEYIIAIGYDKKGKILLWNMAAASASGHEEKVVQGKSIETFVDIDDPHACRRSVHSTLYTKGGTYNLRGTICSLYSEGNPKKIGHVFLAPCRSSEALRFVHSYRTEQINSFLEKIKENEQCGDIFEIQKAVPSMEKVARLMDWNSVVTLSEAIEKQWIPVTRSQLLGRLKTISHQIEITETVPEKFSLDLDLLMVVLTEVASNRRAKIQVEGVELGTEYMSLDITISPTGGSYPFHLEEIEDHLGLELGRLGCHLNLSDDQTILTLQLPTVVNLHLESETSDKDKDSITVCLYGAGGENGFARPLARNLLHQNPNVVFRLLHRSTHLALAVRSSHVIVTTPQDVHEVREALEEVRADFAPRQESFSLPAVCVVTPKAGGAAAAVPDLELRPHESRLTFPFNEEHIHEWLHSLTRYLENMSARETFWAQGPLLGRGATGTVYEAILAPGETAANGSPRRSRGSAPTLTLAIKHIQKESPADGLSAEDNNNKKPSSPSSPETLWKEVDLLRTLNHANVIALHFVEEQPTRFSVGLELCAGSIADVGSSDTAEITRLIRQVVQGVAYLHRKNIIHRDLKTSNVLLTSDGNVKLSDFGVAELNDGAVENALHEMAGTYRFMAPEVFRGEVATSASDIWSIGCILCEILDALPLFMKKRQHLRLASLTHVELPRKLTDPALREFLAACFQMKPSDRPSAEQLLSFSYLLSPENDPVRLGVLSGGGPPNLFGGGTGPSLFDVVGGSQPPPGLLSAGIPTTTGHASSHHHNKFMSSVASSASGFTLGSSHDGSLDPSQSISREALLGGADSVPNKQQ